MRRRVVVGLLTTIGQQRCLRDTREHANSKGDGERDAYGVEGVISSPASSRQPIRSCPNGATAVLQDR